MADAGKVPSERPTWKWKALSAFAVVAVVALLLVVYFWPSPSPPGFPGITFVTLPESLVPSEGDNERIFANAKVRALFNYYTDESGVEKNVHDLGLEVVEIKGLGKPVEGSVELVVKTSYGSTGEVTVKPVLSAQGMSRNDQYLLLQLRGKMIKLSPDLTLTVDPARPIIPEGYIQELYYADDVAIENVEARKIDFEGNGGRGDFSIGATLSASETKAIAKVLKNALFGKYQITIPPHDIVESETLVLPLGSNETIKVDVGGTGYLAKLLKAEYDPLRISILLNGSKIDLEEQQWYRCDDKGWAVLALERFDRQSNAAVLAIKQLKTSAIRGLGVRLRFKAAEPVISSAPNIRGRSNELPPAGPDDYPDPDSLPDLPANEQVLSHQPAIEPSDAEFAYLNKSDVDLELALFDVTLYAMGVEKYRCYQKLPFEISAEPKRFGKFDSPSTGYFCILVRKAGEGKFRALATAPLFETSGFVLVVDGKFPNLSHHWE